MSGARVLHVLHNGIPDVTGGSVRSHYMVRTQAKLGCRTVVVTSPFQAPLDPKQGRGIETIDGIAYHRTFDPTYDDEFMAANKPLWKRARKLLAAGPFTLKVGAVARRERSQVIHGHSLFYCGISAALAARRLGLPSVYEVRSLIEDGLAQEGGTRPGGGIYSAYRVFDWLALRLATHVVVICEGLRAHLVERGIPTERITVVENGVDATVHAPAPERDPGLADSLGLPRDAFVLGYIGSLLSYESLDVLVGEFGALRARLPQARVLIVGDGPARAELEKRVREAGLEHQIRLIGRVPHESVGRYYGAIDLFVLPRRSTRLTNTVTPLKPLEIMARGKPVLASDCGGHRELIQDGGNGFLYRADRPGALAEAVVRLAGMPDHRREVSRAGRDWVVAHRSWEAVTRRSVDLYERLLAGRRGRGGLREGRDPGSEGRGAVDARAGGSGACAE